MRYSCVGRWIPALLAAAAAAVLALCGAVPAGRAEDPASGTFGLEERGLELKDSSVRYPAVTGLDNEELEKAVNGRIAEDGRIPDYLTRLSQLMTGGSLRVTWQGGLLGDVFSCAFAAEGAVRSPRPEFVWTWSNIDLRDGREILPEDLFEDPDAALAAAEANLEENAAPEMSAHLLNSSLTPLPEGFFLERTGITWLYPEEQLSTLSDRAGAVKLGWHELRDTLKTGEDDLPQRLGIREMTELGPGSAGAILRMAESGSLTDIPARIGDGLQALTDAFGLLTDPDVYEGGRMFAPEGAAFRGVYLLTDFLSEAWDESVVQGIRADRGCFWGLCVGETSREAWQAVLGAPAASAELDGDRAEARRMVPGVTDYYPAGDYLLQLHADEGGTLACVILMEQERQNEP